MEEFLRTIPVCIIIPCKQGETKIKYVIQFGIAPFVKEQMIRDFKLQPFSFKL